MTETFLGMPAWLICIEAWGVCALVALALALWMEAR